jgi:acyl-CoA synthetase (NDP forming)
MLRQAGAISVANREEMVDTMTALVRLPPPRGRRMALLAPTGGTSVGIADAAGRAGLEAPALSPHSYQQLGEFWNMIGGSYRNPLDMGSTTGQAEGNFARILEILAEDENIDGMIYDLGPGGLNRRDPERLQRMLAALDAFRDTWGKPIVLASMLNANPEPWVATRNELVARGYTVFASVDRAAQAYARVAAYWAEREERRA